MAISKFSDTRTQQAVLACMLVVFIGPLLAISAGSFLPQWIGAALSLVALIAGLSVMWRAAWLRGWLILAFLGALGLAVVSGRWLLAAN